MRHRAPRDSRPLAGLALSPEGFHGFARDGIAANGSGRALLEPCLGRDLAALAALACRHPRPPSKTCVADMSKDSVRRAAARALLYNFPARRRLHRPDGIAAWRQAERFRTRQPGVVFVGLTPNIRPPLPDPH
jgi:hypothetical protein